MGRKRMHKEKQQEVRKLNKKTVERGPIQGPPCDTCGPLFDLIEALPDAVFFKDVQGRHLFVNKACAKLAGVGKEKMLRKTDKQLLPPDLAEQCALSDQKAIDSRRPVRFEETITGAEGKQTFLETIKVPFLDKRGDVAGLVGVSRDITDRKRVEDKLAESNGALRAQTDRLNELNTALKVLLERREKDKEALEENVVSNVKELILPYLETLKKTQLDTKQMTCVDIVESNLKEIVSPFLQKLSSKYSGLTPKEIQIAALIKQGKTTKEIAELFNLSMRTIKFHRQNIRAKLGLKNQPTNLASHLLSIP